MLCISRPEITAEQIKICEQCKFASAKKVWCCKFGFYFIQPEKQIIQPDKVVIVPPSQKNEPKSKPTLLQMATDFAKAMLQWSGKGFACVSKDEYVVRYKYIRLIKLC